MHTRATPLVRPLLLSLVLAAGLAACRGDAPRASTDKGPGKETAATDGIIIPQPLAYAQFPVDSATILQWVAAVDTASIRQHAWNLWAGLTAMTNQTSGGAQLPVYETWLSRYEVYGNLAQADRQALAARGRTVDRGFHSPVQFHHPAAFAQTRNGTAGQQEQVVAGVKYNMASAYHVWNHNYTDSARLDSLNNAFTAASTPVADRNIVPFPDSAIATKPVYWLVNQTGLTLMPYWAGPDSSSNPSQPEPSTWTQFVAIDPTGKLAGQTVTVTGPDSGTYAVIGLDQFYSFTLTQDEVNDVITTDTTTGSTPLDLEIANDSIAVIINGQQSNQQVTVGDFAVLVAMHVSTKEIGDWTWQTFWWTPNPQADPLASDKPASVQGPFRNFAMQQAYYMTVPNTSPAQNQVTFNPYLETAFADSGTVSNCMSCHRMASWTTNDYHFYGDISPADSTLFAGVTKLDFLWSVQAGASTAQTSLVRRIRSRSRAQPAPARRDTPSTAPPAPAKR